MVRVSASMHPISDSNLGLSQSALLPQHNGQFDETKMDCLSKYIINATEGQ